jgi:DNA-binding transcriptional ArsR family regulator
MLQMTSPSPTPDPTAAADAYEALFTALAHPARRRILISLNFSGGEMTAGAIAALFVHAWPTTTRHLQALEAAGIIRHERRGRTRVYALQRAPLALARDWLGWFGRDPITAKEYDHEPAQAGDAPPLPHQHRSGGA